MFYERLVLQRLFYRPTCSHLMASPDSDLYEEDLSVSGGHILELFNALQKGLYFPPRWRPLVLLLPAACPARGALLSWWMAGARISVVQIFKGGTFCLFLEARLLTRSFSAMPLLLLSGNVVELVTSVRRSAGFVKASRHLVNSELGTRSLRPRGVQLPSGLLSSISHASTPTPLVIHLQKISHPRERIRCSAVATAATPTMQPPVPLADSGAALWRCRSSGADASTFAPLRTPTCRKCWTLLSNFCALMLNEIFSFAMLQPRLRTIPRFASRVVISVSSSPASWTPASSRSAPAPRRSGSFL